MHSKFLGHHRLELLVDSTHKAIKQKSRLYTWSNLDGDKEEVDGLTILVLILGQIRPNFKVNMYAEIGKVKKLTIPSTTMTFSCFSMQSNSSNFTLTRRTLLHTQKMHSFGIFSFNSKMNLSPPILGMNFLAKKIIG
jgi:hypothetical protein